MKKNLLLFLILILNCANSFAGTISVGQFISGQDVSIAHLESFRKTVVDVINGNIEGGSQNIKAGSITSAELATAVSPVTFRNEAFNDWTFSGMLAPTSASLSSTISAGVSYVNGVRIQSSDTAHTFTASKDTYVYINAGGFFEYSEVTLGATAPATPVNDLLLFKATTSGTAVTSVSDQRTLSIQITANSSNFAADYRDQALVVRDSTTAVHIEPGQVAIGNTLYTNTTDTSSRSIATGTNWIEGSAPTPSNAGFYVYGYNNSGTGFDFKYSSADPVYSDMSSNTGGTLRYYTTGGVTYRALGWVYVSAADVGTIQTKHFANFFDGAVSNIQVASYTGYTRLTSVTIPGDNTIPQINEGGEFMRVTYRASNVNDKLKIYVHYCGASDNTDITTVALYQVGTSNALNFIMSHSTGANNMCEYNFMHVMMAGTTSPITFTVRAGSNTSGAMDMNGRSGAGLGGGALESYIKIEEVQG